MDQDILKNIENKMTGNIEEDYKFILKEASHFQALEAFDMVSEIMKLLGKHYGEEGKKFILDKLKENVDTRKRMYLDVIEKEKQKKFAEAQEGIVKLIDTFPIKRKLNDNQMLVSFNNLIETVIYSTLYNKDKKELVRLEEPYSNYYFHLGFNLFQLQDFEEAIKMLDISLKYDPVTVDAMLLKAECYYNLGDLGSFFDTIDYALLHAYNKFHLANAYYLLTKYYVSIGDKKMSQACSLISKNYLVTTEINALTDQANKLQGEDLDYRDVNAIKGVFDSHKTQFGPSKEILGVLAKALQDEKTKSNVSLKYYYLSILFDITKDPSLQKQLEELKPEIEKIQKENK